MAALFDVVGKLASLPLPHCRYRGWSEYRCRRWGWVGGRCFEHALERLRWERHFGRLYMSFDAGNCNRPSLRIDEDRPVRWVSLSWSNGSCDPVWMLELRRGGTSE
jgi:hypothetical protein